MNASVLRLKNLKAWQLKHWAFLTGHAISGTKPELQENVLRHMKQLQGVVPRSTRIVSVDMGIRNLAFCAIDTPGEAPEAKRTYKVATWKRMDLTLADGPATPTAVGNEIAAAEESSAEVISNQRRKKLNSKSDAFSPPALAKTAVNLVNELSSYNAETILIERQRFRTAGRAAIQEWTVRVNMLESMLWACFETMQTLNSTRTVHHPSLHAISPARVAHFWIARHQMSLDPPADLFSPTSKSDKVLLAMSSSKKKVDKQDKIDVVRSWVTGHSDVQLEFTEETAYVAATFQRTRGGAGKLDDLADCLLQAVAWARWEENQRKIKVLWDRVVAGTERSDDAR